MKEKLNEIGQQQIDRVSVSLLSALQTFTKGGIELQKLHDVVEAAFSPFREQIQAFQKALASAFIDIKRVIEKLPEKNRQALKILAKNGWYPNFDLSLPILFEMATKFSSGDNADANNILCDHFDSHITDIELDFNKKLPVRGRLLSYAFQAHRQGDYALSIPVFLAQADGICQEITGIQLYSRNYSGIPMLASVLITPDISPFYLSILTPIIEPMPISASRNEREQMDNILNRHIVLHGESTDYDNRLNSCRAISLLIYVEWVLRNRE